ncbi:MAG: aspartate/glutamate racemase family protein [Thermomicrobiales bacterium]
MSRILYIVPVGIDGALTERGVAECIRPGNEIDAVGFDRGPRHVEYHYYETLMLPHVVHTIAAAERQGYDAAVIGCFYDFGLQEGREIATRMVVTAPCEASCLLAASLGATFSIIVGRRKWIPQMRATVGAYGLTSRLASFRTLDFGVLDYHVDERETERRFVAAGEQAIEEDGAEVIVLGCTASDGFYQRLQAILGVPVIDSAIAAVKQAEHLIEVRDGFGWSHAKIGGYESPPENEITAWQLREEFAADTVTERWVWARPLALDAAERGL